MNAGKIGLFLAVMMMVMGAVSASPLSIQQQTELLARTGTGKGGWFVEPSQDVDWEKWHYAVTDLNHDGTLEILKAKSGFYEGTPCLVCEELTGPDGQRRSAALNLAGSAHVPDLLSSEDAGQAKVIYDGKNKRYYYIFAETIMHGEFASDTSQYALCLVDGDLFIVELAVKNWQLSGKDGTVKEKYYISEPLKKEVSARRYNNILKERFPGALAKEGKIHWLSAKELWPYLEKGNAGTLLQLK